MFQDLAGTSFGNEERILCVYYKEWKRKPRTEAHHWEVSEYQREGRLQKLLERKKQITHRSLGIRITLNFSATTLKNEHIHYGILKTFSVVNIVPNLQGECFSTQESTSQQTINQKIKCTGTIKTFSDRQWLENELPIHSFSGSHQRTYSSILYKPTVNQKKRTQKTGDSKQ